MDDVQELQSLHQKDEKSKPEQSEESLRALFEASNYRYQSSRAEAFRSQKNREANRQYFNAAVSYHYQLKELQAKKDLKSAVAQEKMDGLNPWIPVKKHWAEFRLGQNKEEAIGALRAFYTAFSTHRKALDADKHGELLQALAIAALASGRAYIEQGNPKAGKAEIERADAHIKAALAKTKNLIFSDHPNHAKFLLDQNEITYYLGIACLGSFDEEDALDFPSSAEKTFPAAKEHLRTSPFADQAYRCFESLQNPKTPHPIYARALCEAKVRQGRFMLGTLRRFSGILEMEVPHCLAFRREALEHDRLNGAVYFWRETEARIQMYSVQYVPWYRPYDDELAALCYREEPNPVIPELAHIHYVYAGDSFLNLANTSGHIRYSPHASAPIYTLFTSSQTLFADAIASFDKALALKFWDIAVHRSRREAVVGWFNDEHNQQWAEFERLRKLLISTMEAALSGTIDPVYFLNITAYDKLKLFLEEASSPGVIAKMLASSLKSLTPKHFLTPIFQAYFNIFQSKIASFPKIPGVDESRLGDIPMMAAMHAKPDVKEGKGVAAGPDSGAQDPADAKKGPDSRPSGSQPLSSPSRSVSSSFAAPTSPPRASSASTANSSSRLQEDGVPRKR